jgi:glycosyltransferase involved in cell wall biosynthesis
VRGLKALLPVLPTAKAFNLDIIWDIGVEKTYARFYRVLNRYVLRHVTMAVTEGPSVSEQLFGTRSGSNKIAELLPPISPERGKRMLYVYENRSPSLSPPTILLLGSIHPRKGQSTAIKAMRHVINNVPAAVLMIVGGSVNARYERRIKKLARSCGVQNNVHFLGWREDVEHLMAQARLLLLPSKSEGLPHVVKEAMLAGVPVISSRVGAIPDVIQHQVTGWLVEQSRSKVWGETISKVLQEPDETIKVAERAHQEALRLFELHSWINKYQQAIHRVL